MEAVLQIDNLVKNYKQKTVLNSVSMTVNRGDIYGFVGKNGAGKTTLIRVISGLTNASDGSYSLFGVKNTERGIDDARKKVCTMVETPALHLDLSAYDNMKLQCLITGRPFSCIDELLRFVNLSDTGKKKAKNFSLGMRQRLGIAVALVNEPELMLLDEPINGLDPEGIRQIRELLLKMHEEKKVTILISSHILSELSLFATRYGFIDSGNIIKEATIEEIREATKENCYIEVDDVAVADKLLRELGYEPVSKEKGFVIDGDIELMKVCATFAANNVRLTKHVRNDVDLENYFINLIGGAL